MSNFFETERENKFVVCLTPPFFNPIMTNSIREDLVCICDGLGTGDVIFYHFHTADLRR
jgi:hypothetical protein